MYFLVQNFNCTLNNPTLAFSGLVTFWQNKQTDEQRNKHAYKWKSDLTDFFTCIILHLHQRRSNLLKAFLTSIKFRSVTYWHCITNIIGEPRSYAIYTFIHRINEHCWQWLSRFVENNRLMWGSRSLSMFSGLTWSPVCCTTAQHP